VTYVGLAGAVVLLAVYAAGVRGALRTDRALYDAGNLVGAGLILASLTADWNLPTLLLEGTWALVAAAALVGHAVRRRP
jgi:hypothetical protein